MSVELGVPSRSIRYLNINREGVNKNDTCSVDSRWSNPLLDKQDEYLVAITRFEVPLNRIPVTQKMDNCIEIFRYDDTAFDIEDDDGEVLRSYTALNHQNIEDYADVSPDGQATFEQAIEYLEASETREEKFNNMTVEAPDPNDGKGNAISMPPCHTIYEFLNKLNAQIHEALLFNQGNKQIVPEYIVTDNTQENGFSKMHRSDNFLHRNQYTEGQNGGTILNDTEPIAYFLIKMDSDFRFRVEMNYAFANKYYIKMSQALFNMLGFVEQKSTLFERTNLPGRRFMGDRCREANRVDLYNERLAAVQLKKPPYTFLYRRVSTFRDTDAGAGTANTIESKIKTTTAGQIIDKQLVTRFESALSSADSYNRIKAIVFSSSLATTSEGATGNTYRRLLTDFTIPTRSSFSYDPNTRANGSVTENAASEVTFTNTNPSAGRFLMLSDPSPLYEIKVDCNVKVFNFETGQFEFEPIPLPMGGTFSCKLVFISRSELYRRDRPDRLKG